MANKFYQQVAQSIKNDYILAGKVAPGGKLPSVRDLAEQYSVGRSAIWHALSMLEAQKYIDKKAGSGCYVCEAQPVNVQMNKVIGFVGCSNVRSLCYDIQRGAEWVCGEYGHQILVANNQLEYKVEQKQIEKMVDNGCLGIIVYPIHRTREQLQNDYLKTRFKDVPIVLVDMAYSEQERSRVIFDNYQAGYDITKALIMMGHERIACAKAQDNVMQKSSHDRFRGYCHAMNKAGLPLIPLNNFVLSKTMSNEQQIEEMFGEWKNLSHDDRWTSIIALQDTQALSMMEIAKNFGIQIPEDIFIAGYDNDPAICQRDSYLTTEPDFYHAGKIAARLLIDQINSGICTTSTYILQLPIKSRGMNRLTSTHFNTDRKIALVTEDSVFAP